MKKRVVVTGLGTINPVGNNVNEMYQNMIKGVNGINHITYFDTTNFKVKVAGELKKLNLEDYFDLREIKKSDRSILLAQIAAKEAYEDAKLDETMYDAYRFGNYTATGIGGIGTMYNEIKTGLEKGFNRMSPHFAVNAIPNMPAAVVSIKYGLKGPIVPIVTACAASNNAIGEAYKSIKDGYLDLAFAGGAEAAINEVGIAGFAALRALTQSDDINRASIPFDLQRSGFVMGEGAGMLVLEEYEHAKKRGAKIYAEIVGYGSTSDAYHVTAPSEDASGITRAMIDALNEANIDTVRIGYINAHGTSTKLNDRTETLAIKNVFKENAYNVNISSTKSMTGHMLGATGAIEAIVCIKTINEGIIPPTINYLEKDEECDLNYTPNNAITKNVEYAMNLNLGFGGHNGVLIFKKGDE